MNDFYLEGIVLVEKPGAKKLSCQLSLFSWFRRQAQTRADLDFTAISTEGTLFTIEDDLSAKKSGVEPNC